MNTVTVSSKFQVVIPKEIREDIGLRVGATMGIITYGGGLNLYQSSNAIAKRNLQGYQH